MSVVRNEQTKLTATLLNTLAAAAIVAGAISPLVGLLYGFVPLTQPAVLVAVIATFWILLGAGLHVGARAMMRRLLS